MEFQTAAQAKAYILAHDDDARALNRKPRYELVAIESSEMAARGMVRVFGNLSRDELINFILDSRYPRVAEARRVYYAAQPCGCWNYTHLGRCIHKPGAVTAVAEVDMSEAPGPRVSDSADHIS